MRDRPYRIKDHKEHEIGRFCIVQDTIEIDSIEYPYSYIKSKPCVCVLPVLDGKLVLIRQYRHIFNQWFYEIPAGGIEEGENPEDAAVRELREETGCTACQMIELGCMPVSLGTSSLQAYLYVAICNERTTQHLERTELIEVEEKSMEEFEQMIADREFTHMVGITIWHLYCRQAGFAYL